MTRVLCSLFPLSRLGARGVAPPLPAASPMSRCHLTGRLTELLKAKVRVDPCTFDSSFHQSIPAAASVHPCFSLPCWPPLSVPRALKSLNVPPFPPSVPPFPPSALPFPLSCLFEDMWDHVPCLPVGHRMASAPWALSSEVPTHVLHPISPPVLTLPQPPLCCVPGMACLHLPLPGMLSRIFSWVLPSGCSVCFKQHLRHRPSLST